MIMSEEFFDLLVSLMTDARMAQLEVELHYGTPVEE